MVSARAAATDCISSLVFGKDFEGRAILEAVVDIFCTMVVGENREECCSLLCRS